MFYVYFCLILYHYTIYVVLYFQRQVFRYYNINLFFSCCSIINFSFSSHFSLFLNVLAKYSIYSIYHLFLVAHIAIVYEFSQSNYLYMIYYNLLCNVLFLHACLHSTILISYDSVSITFGGET